MKVSAIAAMSSNRVIGKDNKLPWKIPEDMKRFRTITSGNPVIMGRKTYESIGKPLPGRQNIILSTQTDYKVEGALVFQGINQALAYCENNFEDKEVFIIGGEQIYTHGMKYVRKIYLTIVNQEFEGDAFFPEFEGFKETSREERQEPIPHSYVIYER